MRLRDRLKVLLNHLRRPDSKPVYIERLERRQDEVEKRINEISVEEARHAERVIKASRS